MNENKIKHLEFIQNNIARMSTNSFLIKGWSITLISALFVLAQKDTNKDYLLLPCFTIPLFWYLNGYFLLQERKFRALYDSVRHKEDLQIDFAMNISEYKKDKCTLTSSLFSMSIWPIYLSMLGMTIIFIFLTR